MSYDGNDQLARVREVGHLLLSCCSDDGLSGGFPVTKGFPIKKSQFGLVEGVEESLIELSVRPETTWDGQTEGTK